MNFTGKGSAGPQGEELSLWVCVFSSRRTWALGPERAGRRAAQLESCVVTLAWQSELGAAGKGQRGHSWTAASALAAPKAFCGEAEPWPLWLLSSEGVGSMLSVFQLSGGGGCGGGLYQSPAVSWRSQRPCHISLQAGLRGTIKQIRAVATCLSACLFISSPYSQAVCTPSASLSLLPWVQMVVRLWQYEP